MLRKIYDYINSKRDIGGKNYCLPCLWIYNGYNYKESADKKRFFVNPYDYFSEVINDILLKSDEKIEYSVSYSKILSLKRGEEILSRDWINTSSLYGFFVRMTTAYNHKGFWKFQGKNSMEFTEDGSFLKSIVLLPFLKEMGIDTIYSLPITKYSHRFKKGELPSPYAVKNFLKVEDSYKDELLTPFTVEDEFKSFVEACHILGIRVILDFVPRTASRDNDLILEHPEWFYWIKSEFKDAYKSPFIDGLPFCQPSEENLDSVYSAEQTRELLKYFTHDPKTMDPEKWSNIVASNSENPDFMSVIEEEFGITTPPGFSDWINDTQPPWSDVTFLKLFNAPPNISRKYTDADQAPYLLFDIIKSSNFENDSPNLELWEYLIDIIPSYQKRFGIDGVRLDMGHALPRNLESAIIENAREIDPSFVFIAEELEIHKDEKAKEHGYDAILGNSWWMQPRIDDGKCFEFSADLVKNLKLPTLATAETPDTPRAVSRKYGKRFAMFSAVLNTFLPNGIRFINSGFEISEKQPMNLGLDNSEEGRYMLSDSDPMSGKLAFFDHYQLHWDEADTEMLDLVKTLGEFKIKYGEWCRKEYLIDGYLTHSDRIIAHMFKHPSQSVALVAISNSDFSNGQWITIDAGNIPDIKLNRVKKKLREFKNAEDYLEIENGYVHVYLGPGEASVLTIR